jgi:hypothetical protein
VTEEEALQFVADHGVVLVSARGPVPSLAEAIAGAPVRGSWWGHPQGKAMFRIFSALGEHPDVLVCRLVGGKVTYVHRRLWPALVRAAARFPPERVALARNEHTETGAHARRDVPFPQWVDAETEAAAARLSEPQALAALGPWTESAAARSRP